LVDASADAAVAASKAVFTELAVAAFVVEVLLVLFIICTPPRTYSVAGTRLIVPVSVIGPPTRPLPVLTKFTAMGEGQRCLSRFYPALKKAPPKGCR
jgi:hypothetical protein